MHPELPGLLGANSFQLPLAPSRHQMLCVRIFQNECVAKRCSPVDVSRKPFKSLLNSQSRATAFTWEKLATAKGLEQLGDHMEPRWKCAK